MKRTLLASAALLLALAVVSASAQTKSKAPQKPNILKQLEEAGDFAPMFEFQPTHDVHAPIANVQTWKGFPQGEAGAQGFIKPEGDHFIDGSGQTRRFWGTNICFSGCFPEKGDAEKLAAEMACYGINLVRLHYVHHNFPENRIYPEKDSFIEPEQLDRFDYLFAQLKKHGIYTYFQLNIARKFGAQNGFENAGKLPFYNNGIDNVDERMIELQKKYHKDILCHVNPYTGLEYRNDPAIAMLELVNENTILYAWFSSKHKFDHLTEPYASKIRSDWNEWLLAKYENTQNLKDAWLSGLKGSGEEYIPDGVMMTSLDELWKAQNDKISVSDVEFCKAGKSDNLDGKYFMRINVEKKGVQKNIPQIFRKDIQFKDGEPLCLKFKVRSSLSTTIRVRVSQNHAPYGIAGLSSTFKCTPEWKEQKINFCSNMDDDNLRLVFSDFAAGTYDIADLSLVSGIDCEWDESRTLEAKNIDWPYNKDWALVPERSRDFIDFLAKYERDYFDELYTNVKTNVQPKQAVGGTQLLFGMNYPQAKMDYCDAHSYWCHPAFPGKAWSTSNWYVLNNALVNGDGYPCNNLGLMSRSRILGKPFTISEYDHPNLNLYSAEGDILACATGAFQNWSAIMQFAWTHDTNYFRSILNPRFDMCSATHKLVHFPACYAMFVRGDIAPGDTSTMYVTYSDIESEVSAVAKAKSVKGPAMLRDYALAASALAMRSGRKLGDLPELFSEEGKTIVVENKNIPGDIRRAYDNKNVKSSTGQLNWNWQETGAGYFTADSPLTKAFTGFVRGRSFSFDGMTLKPGKTRLDWLTFTLTNTSPSSPATKGKLQKGNYLLAITSLCYNANAYYVDLGSKRISCGKDNGGSAGSGNGPVMCEGVPATLTLNGLSKKVKCYALDPSGKRMKEVQISADAKGNAVVLLSPKYKTVWYELIIK